MTYRFASIGVHIQNKAIMTHEHTYRQSHKLAEDSSPLRCWYAKDHLENDVLASRTYNSID